MRQSDLYNTENVGDPRWTRTGRHTSDAREQSYVTDDDRPWDDLGQEESSPGGLLSTISSWLPFSKSAPEEEGDEEEYQYDDRFGKSKWKKYRTPAAVVAAAVAATSAGAVKSGSPQTEGEVEIVRPDFVFEHPYISSSYYTSTKSLKTLQSVDKFQVQPKKEQLAGKKADGEKDFTRETQTRLAILRPFCAFDAGPLPTTFDCKSSRLRDIFCSIHGKNLNFSLCHSRLAVISTL